jgi:hypothetical protein
MGVALDITRHIFVGFTHPMVSPRPGPGVGGDKLFPGFGDNKAQKF